jgi:hypothetical protein
VFPFLAPQAFWAVEKWESWFWISTFPRPTVFLGFGLHLFIKRRPFFRKAYAGHSYASSLGRKFIAGEYLCDFQAAGFA